MDRLKILTVAAVVVVAAAAFAIVATFAPPVLPSTPVTRFGQHLLVGIGATLGSVWLTAKVSDP